VIYGRIVEIQELDGDSLNTNEKEWFLADSKNIESAPNVIGNLPDQIDVLLLDGGEFSSFAEYLNLRDRGVKWLILDDVNIRKNKKVLADALESGKFFEVWKSNERNGTAILRIKT
jgi:hypothetical protein